MERTFFRKSKESLPVLAICYDFDKTLSPDDMQAQGYIQDVGYDVEHFWEEANELAFENGMDQNLAYMYKMVEEAEGNIIVKREALEAYGAKVALFPGVDTWFDRIRQYGEEKKLPEKVCLRKYTPVPFILIRRVWRNGRPRRSITQIRLSFYSALKKGYWMSTIRG